MTMVIDGTNGVQFPDNSIQTGAIGRNRIINGAMVIDQRNAGASVTPANAAYTLDRWKSSASQSSKYTIQQNAASVTPPAGFTNYLGVTSSSAYTVGASDSFNIYQNIEGYNIADLAWGTANAKTVTLSFWVRSSLTGTFGGAIYNNDGTRSYPFSYTISSANTWEQKTVTIAGDTTGTWLTTNGTGISLEFSLGAGSTYSGTANTWAGALYLQPTGSTSVVGTNGATFYITGVQLEKGSTATSFDYRPFGTEVLLCQRYYEKSVPITVAPLTSGYIGKAIYMASSRATGYCFYSINHKVEKRATPTITLWSYAGTSGQIGSFDSGSNLGAGSALQNSTDGFLLCNNSGGTIAANAIQANYSADAEL